MNRIIAFTSLMLTVLPCLAQQPADTPIVRPRVDIGSASVPVLSGAAAAETPSTALTSEARSAAAASTLSRFGIPTNALSNQNVSVLNAGVLTRVTESNVANLVNTASVVVERTGDAVTLRNEGNEQRFRLPLTFRQIVQTNGSTRELEYAPEVVPQSALRYFGDRRQYVANVRLGVFESNPSGERPLSEPVVLSLTSVSLNGIDPEDLEFSRLNRFQEVEVTASSLAAPPSLSVRPNFEPQGFDVPLPVGERPTARVSFDRGSILGLGLETATANIQVLNVENPAGLEVQMRIDSGSLANDGRVTGGVRA